MIRTALIWIAAAALALLAASTQVGADNNTRIESPSKRWHNADACKRDAFKKYPDYTQEGAAKRDAYVKQCLRDHNLPPPADSNQTKAPGQ